MSQACKDRMFVGQRCRAVAKESQYVAGSVERVRDQTGRHDGTYRVQLIFERCRHTEVSAAAANGPEQIVLLILACPHHLSLGSDELDGLKVIQGEAMLAHQPAQPAPQRQPGD